MFAKIRKHQGWLWLIIIGAMVVPMMFYFNGPTSQGNGRRGGNRFGTVDGVPITQSDYDKAYREAFIRHLVFYGANSKSSFNETAETYQRIFLIKKLAELNIQVDSESVAMVANEILMEFGRGRPVPLDTFITQLQTLVPRATAEDFENYVRHEVGLQQLSQVVGLNGDLVTPQEAQSLYIQRHQELATEAVFFSATNYLTAVPPAPAGAIARFYTNHMADYRVADRVQVTYVSFDATNFYAEVFRTVTNLTEEVDANVARLGTNYTHYGKTPEEARKKIGEELLRQHGLFEARKKAILFANELYAMTPASPDNLATLAKKSGLTAKLSAPFDQVNGPTEFDGGPNFANASFRLTPDEPFPDQLIASEEALFVIALNKKIPTEIPPLDLIHAKVVTDYRNYQALELSQQAGMDFDRKLTNGFAQGKTFAAICTNAAVKPMRVPPFSLSTRELPEIEPHTTLQHYRAIAESVPPGKTSGFEPTENGGLIVYVEKRLPIDDAKMKAELPAFTKMLRSMRQQQAMDSWYQREFSKSMADIPNLQRRPSSASGQGGS